MAICKVLRLNINGLGVGVLGPYSADERYSQLQQDPQLAGGADTVVGHTDITRGRAREITSTRLKWQ